MKTDRELLELAAKAYGNEYVKPGKPEFTRWIGYDANMGCDVLVHWNPLLDDGDALRLAVSLDIPISPESANGCVWICSAGIQINEPMLNNPLAATRRAIVRAAAAIGESKE